METNTIKALEEKLQAQARGEDVTEEEKLVEALDAVEEASNSDAPIVVETEESKTVTGDTTQVGDTEPSDYLVNFHLPKDLAEQVGVTGTELSDHSISVNLPFEGKIISPRKARKLRNDIINTAQLFVEFKDDGTVEVSDPKNVIQFYREFTEEVIDSCEKVVSTVLDIPDELMEYISDIGLLDAVVNIIKRNPGFFQVG